MIVVEVEYDVAFGLMSISSVTTITSVSVENCSLELFTTIIRAVEKFDLLKIFLIVGLGNFW